MSRRNMQNDVADADDEAIQDEDIHEEDYNHETINVVLVRNQLSRLAAQFRADVELADLGPILAAVAAELDHRRAIALQVICEKEEANFAEIPIPSTKVPKTKH